jgi:type IV pilus assembly protein PilA
MYTRLRKALQNRQDKGFTLIELLVVIIIIGILAAIAIPVYLSQRHKAVDAAEKSDVRTIATEMETFFTDAQSYPVATQVAASAPVNGVVSLTFTPAANGTPDTVVLSSGDTAHIKTNAAATAYCVTVSNPQATQTWVWESDAGGLQPSAVNACDALDTLTVL